MYDANASYEHNYERGPSAALVAGGKLPLIEYVDAPCFSFLGVPLHIPFGIPAGPLLNSAYVATALDAGFCLPTYKTVRTRAYASHPFPNVLSVTPPTQGLHSFADNRVVARFFKAADYQNSHALSITNSFGVPSKDPDVWRKDYLTLARPREGSAVVLSFQGTRESGASFEDFLADISLATKLAASTVEQAGGKILELNLSCPNEQGEPLFYDVERSARVLATAREVIKGTKIKLIAKIGALESQKAHDFVFETRGLVDALSAINTVACTILGEDGKTVLGSGAQKGGVCGNAIFRAGVETIAALSKARRTLKMEREELELIGVGGVSTVAHFEAYLDAGASCVQSATGAMWNLGLARDVASHLKVKFKETMR